MIKQVFLFSILLGTVAASIFSSNYHTNDILQLMPQVSDTMYFEDLLPYKSVRKNEKIAIFKGNEQITPFKYKMVKAFGKEGLLHVKVSYDSAGFVDKTGKEIIPPIYWISEYETFNNGVMYVSKAGDKYQYFLNSNGKVEKDIYSSVGVLKHVMNPTKFPVSLSTYKKLEANIVFDNGNCFRCDGITKWTTESMLGRALRAFAEEPRSYGLDVNIITAYGLPGGGGNYWNAMKHAQGWDAFQEKAIFGILRNESTRKLVWPWLRDNYKSSYMLLHPQFRKEYKKIAASLKQYFSVNYNPAKVQQYLKDEYSNFAYNNPMDPEKPMIGRKTAAFVERLVYVHKVMTIQDAQKWVVTVCNEIQNWP